MPAVVTSSSTLRACRPALPVALPSSAACYSRKLTCLHYSSLLSRRKSGQDGSARARPRSSSGSGLRTSSAGLCTRGRCGRVPGCLRSISSSERCQRRQALGGGGRLGQKVQGRGQISRTSSCFGSTSDSLPLGCTRRRRLSVDYQTDLYIETDATLLRDFAFFAETACCKRRIPSFRSKSSSAHIGRRIRAVDRRRSADTCRKELSPDQPTCNSIKPTVSGRSGR